MKPSPQQLEAINIACAELDGAIVIPCTCESNPRKDSRTGRHISAYTSDLNAVHRLERRLDCSMESDEAENYVKNLCEVTEVPEKWDEIEMVIAPALQRCIALLMTMAPEKWQEILNMEVTP